MQAAAHALSPSPIQRGPVRGPLEDRAIAGEDGAATGRRARWDLTPAGLALATESAPVLIDDLDRQLLTALARSPRRQLQVVGVIGCYSLTAKRRLGLLIGRGLVRQDIARGPFMITSAGLELLGDHAPKKWLNVESISAAKARDVTCRAELTMSVRGYKKPA